MNCGRRSAYEKSLVIHKRLGEKDMTALILRNLGATYSLERRNSDALRLLRQALKSATTDADIKSPLIAAEVLNCLGIVYYRMGKYRKAEEVLNQAIQMAASSGMSFDTAAMLGNLGAVYQAKHDFERAERLLNEALKITEAKKGSLHPDLSFSLSLLGLLYTETGRYANAEEQYQRALKILQPDKLNFDTRVARILQYLSNTYQRAGRNAEADAALAQAALIARRNLSNHPDLAAIIEDYSATLKKQGRSKEAENLRAEAKRARVAAGLVISVHGPFD
jgi:tetratricopeptide (TPR) repeat protein